MHLHWTHEPLVAETITWFVGRAIPDPGEGWEEGSYEVYDAVPDSPHGKAWLVAYDVPTSVEGMDCWLSFVIDKEPMSDPIVRDVHAVRGGRAPGDFETYVWVDEENTWALYESDDDDDEGPSWPPMQLILGGKDD